MLSDNFTNDSHKEILSLISNDSHPFHKIYIKLFDNLATNNVIFNLNKGS